MNSFPSSPARRVGGAPASSRRWSAGLGRTLAVHTLGVLLFGWLFAVCHWMLYREFLNGLRWQYLGTTSSADLSLRSTFPKMHPAMMLHALSTWHSPMSPLSAVQLAWAHLGPLCALAAAACAIGLAGVWTGSLLGAIINRRSPPRTAGDGRLRSVLATPPTASWSLLVPYAVAGPLVWYVFAGRSSLFLNSSFSQAPIDHRHLAAWGVIVFTFAVVSRSRGGLAAHRRWLAKLGARTCPRCGYDAGHPGAAACPECGAPVAPSSSPDPPPRRPSLCIRCPRPVTLALAAPLLLAGALVLIKPANERLARVRDWLLLREPDWTNPQRQQVIRAQINDMLVLRWPEQLAVVLFRVEPAETLDPAKGCCRVQISTAIALWPSGRSPIDFDAPHRPSGDVRITAARTLVDNCFVHRFAVQVGTRQLQLEMNSYDCRGLHPSTLGLREIRSSGLSEVFRIDPRNFGHAVWEMSLRLDQAPDPASP